MTPQLDKFIALALRPLGKRAAHREEAKSELMGRLSHLGVPVDQLDVSEPIARLESAPPRPAWPRRVALLGSLLVLMTLGFGGAAMEFFHGVRMGMSSSLKWRSEYGSAYYSNGPDFWWRTLLDWADREAPDRPLSGNGEKSEIQELRNRYPEDLALLQEALVALGDSREEFMTVEERAMVDKLDPDNALWALMEVRWNFYKAQGRSSSRGATVPDSEARERGWAVFEQAADKPELVNHALSLQRRQLDAFSPESTVVGGMIRRDFGELPRDALSGGGSSYYRGTSSELRARLIALTKPEELEAFYQKWLRVMSLRVSSPNGVSWDHGALWYDLVEEFQEMSQALRQAGVEKEADWLDEQIRRLNARPTLPPEVEALVGLQIEEERSQPPAGLEPEALLPSRNAEWAWMSRILTWPAAGLVIIFVLLVGFEANRRHATVQGMARGLMPLLTWKDHAWIAGLGIVLPWGYWWVISRLTPMGFPGPDYDDEWLTLAWLLQPTIGLVTGFVLLTQTAQWRWGKIGGFLSLKRGAPWLGWVAAVITGLALPCVGLIRIMTLTNDDEHALFLGGCAGAGCVGLLWLFWVGGMNLFTPRHSALQANLVSRTLRPWALTGLATVLFAAGVLLLAEQHWYRQDTLLPTWTSETFPNRLQELACTERQEFLKSIFDEKLKPEP